VTVQDVVQALRIAESSAVVGSSAHAFTSIAHRTFSRDVRRIVYTYRSAAEPWQRAQLQCAVCAVSSSDFIVRGGVCAQRTRDERICLLHHTVLTYDVAQYFWLSHPPIDIYAASIERDYRAPDELRCAAAV
jgi:hypothetical protein